MPARLNPDPALRFITRMPDSLWRVWITFGKQDFGQHYFSDKEHGSRENALAAAQQYRDAVVNEHQIPIRRFEGNGYYVHDKRSKSGVVGIRLSVDDPEQPTKVNWLVSIMRDGKQRKTARSIQRYGYVGAWQLVASIREKHTGQPAPKSPPAPPDWLRLWAADRDIQLTDNL